MATIARSQDAARKSDSTTCNKENCAREARRRRGNCESVELYKTRFSWMNANEFWRTLKLEQNDAIRLPYHGRDDKQVFHHYINKSVNSLDIRKM